jgi:hypothetical protein
MKKSKVGFGLVAAGVMAMAAAPTCAMAQAAVPQTWQKVVNSQVYTETYGYLDPKTCVVFAAPDLVGTQYKTWFEVNVLVPMGHYEPKAATLAASLTVGGVNGWRIPSLSEVESYKMVQPYIATSTMGVAYWSTETKGTLAATWRVSGNNSWHSRSGFSGWLWPVRDAENCTPVP